MEQKRLEHMRKTAMWLGLIGGLLMVISGTVGGLGFWGNILGYASTHLGGEIGNIVGYILAILTFFVLLGGVSVIIGSFLIGKGLRAGRLLITLGVGLAIWNVLFSIIIALIDGATILHALFSTGLGGIGVLLAAAARFLASV